MNRKLAPSATVPKKRWTPAGWLVPLISVPVLLGLIVVAWLSYRELQAAQQLKSLQTSMRWNVDSLSGDGLNKILRQATSTDQTAEWSRIYFLLSSAEFPQQDQLPIVGIAPLPSVLNPAEPWDAESRVHDYLTHMQPMLKLIHRAAAAQEPTWQPLDFNGYSTLLPHIQAARGAARLLQLEAELALYQGNQERALAAIEALQGTARSIDWGLLMVVQLTHAAINDVALRTIQRSLRTDIWNAEQLEQLMQSIQQPVAIDETFQRVVEHEWALASSVLESDNDFFAGMRSLKFPSAKLAFLRRYRDMEKIADDAGGRLSARVGKYETQWQELPGATGALAGSLLPAFSAYAFSIELSEQLRQLTLVALALKRFRLEHERWPRELGELTELGLSPTDWTIKGVGEVGYSADSQGAYIWGIRREESSVALQRPLWKEDKPEEAYHLVIVSP